MERIVNNGKVLLLALAAVCSLLAGGVHGGCCVSNGGNACAPKTTKAVCDSLSGVYSFDGGAIQSWTCVQNAGGAFECVCPPGSACGDPHIAGFDGSNYILWGQKDKTYDILSERNHQVNIRLFDDITPSSDSGSQESHALFIDAVGFMVNDARITVRMVTTADADAVEPELAGIISLTSAAKSATTKLLAVSTSAPDGTRHHAVWNGKIGQQAVDSHTSYTFIDETRVIVKSSQIALTVILRHNHHLDFQVNAITVSWNNVHGVLGQTYAAAFGGNGATAAAGGGKALGVPEAPIINKQLNLEGKEEDYITSGLLSADDKFSRFVVGGSKLHELVPSNDASAVSRKMMTKVVDNVGSGMVAGGADMVWTDAGLTGE